MKADFRAFDKATCSHKGNKIVVGNLIKCGCGATVGRKGGRCPRPQSLKGEIQLEQSMGITSPNVDEAYSAVRETLRRIYGTDVISILLWTPPGSTKLDLASNCKTKELIRCLRDAANNMELIGGGETEPIPPRKP
jgi:hypothetical protein